MIRLWCRSCEQLLETPEELARGVHWACAHADVESREWGEHKTRDEEEETR